MPGDELPPPVEQPKPLTYEDLVAQGLIAPPLASGPRLGAPLPMEAKPPTSAADWRSARKRGFTVTLPSGMTAHVRRTLDLFPRLERDEIPNPLAGIVTRLIAGEQVEITEDGVGQEGMAAMLGEMNHTIAAMMIVPPCVERPEGAPWDWEPPAGYICTEDIELFDKVFLYNVAQGGTADLATFRKDSEAFVAPLPNGAVIQVPTK